MCECMGCGMCVSAWSVVCVCMGCGVCVHGVWCVCECMGCGVCVSAWGVECTVHMYVCEWYKCACVCVWLYCRFVLMDLFQMQSKRTSFPYALLRPSSPSSTTWQHMKPVRAARGWVWSLGRGHVHLEGCPCGCAMSIRWSCQ